MKIVFLDFDGVINRGHGPFLPDLVARLNRITREAQASIVVHSSWRWARSVRQLKDILDEAGVIGPVIDKCPCPVTYQQTPDGLWVGEDDWESFKGDIATNDERAIAIQKWLNEHPGVTRYVILDDCTALGHFVGTPAFLRTDMREGLTDRHVEQAILHLNG